MLDHQIVFYLSLETTVTNTLGLFIFNLSQWWQFVFSQNIVEQQLSR